MPCAQSIGRLLTGSPTHQRLDLLWLVLETFIPLASSDLSEPSVEPAAGAVGGQQTDVDSNFTLFLLGLYFIECSRVSIAKANERANEILSAGRGVCRLASALRVYPSI